MPRTGVDTKQLVLSMKTAEDNMLWLQEHFTELVGRYDGNWVAIHNGRVVATDSDRERLLEKLRTDHPDYNVYAVQFITADPIDLIL